MAHRSTPRRLSVLALGLALVVAVPLSGCGIGSAQSNQRRVLEQLAAMRTVLEDEDRRADGVSAWSTYQQSEHVLRANEGIAGFITANEEPDEIEGFTLSGRWVLGWGSIPRGAGQAPGVTVPEGLDRQALMQRLATVEQAVQALDPEAIDASDRVVGNHPYFGGLTSARWLRFMGIHGAHHAEIVADIQEASVGG